ncbi:Gfo/Idh/MocA family protein [Nocardia blacklockiae]|uniref:Gfo/Idh/MocA family protein n=1 Tax=Nocardia blacklockiae TaxID=480036 RepID=UPI001893562F|nr:Gfo/Idh/MocA family oxidoreductase [Nocardia blacklockiae]MBF6173691.1 Gfo/Idh/MocA family oxidoreductase [Nocardia blacklockiae]
MTIRLGLAGTGRIGGAHAEILKSLPNVAGVVVADADPERARATATKLGVDFAPDVDALFDADISGLVVATATDSHPELVLAAVDRNLPVFCEKPVAAHIAGTRAVVDHVEKASVPVQIGFQRRFDAGYTAARAAVASGELGWLHTLRATTLDPAPPPADYIPRSGGLFRDCGVHDFDIIRWVTGREVTEVFVLGANRGARFFADAGDVDTAAALLRLDDGALATVSLSRYNGAGYDVRLEALGSKGNVVVGLDDRAPLRSVEPGRSASPYSAYPGFMERFRRAYARELAVFTEVVTGRVESPCTPREALEAFYIAEACELSRRERRPVAVDETR